MAAQQQVGPQPYQREDDKGEALHHQVQAQVFQAVADLLAGQVDPMQEEHQEHADVDDPFCVHGAAGAAERGEQVRQKRGQYHAAQKPVSE